MNGKGHGMHSPFVFNLVIDVLNNRPGYVFPQEVNGWRQELKFKRTNLLIEDLGAGSRNTPAKKRTVQQIARTAVKPQKYTALLYRMVRHYQPFVVLELGTSLGVTTAAMAKAAPRARVITIEGSAAVRDVALKGFKKLGVEHIESLLGNFDDLLPGVLKDLQQVDFAFIDGNHRYAPTISYFNQVMEKAVNETILVFDDIHWSAEMEKAWEAIKNDPRVRCTIDLFFVGIVILRNEFKVPRHFTIRY